MSIDCPAAHQARSSLTSLDLFCRRQLPVLTRYLITQADDNGLAMQVAQDAIGAARDQWAELLALGRPDLWLLTVATRMLRRLEAVPVQRGWPPADSWVRCDLRIAATTDAWVGAHLGIIAALRSLPRRQAEVVSLHFLVGYSIADVAMILGVSDDLSKGQLRRGMEELRTYQVSHLAGVDAELGSLIMSIEHDLRAAAKTIADMPAWEVDRRLAQLSVAACPLGGLTLVMRGQLTAATAHVGGCRPCQDELLANGGIRPASQRNADPDWPG